MTDDDFMSQRKFMSFAVRLTKTDREAIRLYVEAEEKGIVKRESNLCDLDAESYAERLLADGRRKGWLP